MGVVRLLLPRFKNYAFNPHLFQIPRFISTSAALMQRPRTFDLGELDESNGESAVYKRTLQLQRPSTVRFQENMLNSVSLIGYIDAPFKNFDTASGSIGVYTLLKVYPSARAYRNFTVMLNFWDEMAEIAVEHLKLNDLIYVLGSLASFEKMDDDGKSIYCHKVSVKELNFIIQHAVHPSCQNSLKLEPKVSEEDILRMHKTRLHLWQVFFTSSEEWWDNRNNKKNPKRPDFKHKDTGEALWLKDTDPPWVRKQLLLHDSRLNKRGSRKHKCLVPSLSIGL